VKQVKKLYDKTSVEHLHELGVLGPDLIGAHCIYNTDDDLRLMKDSGASVLHCPRPFLLGRTTAPLAKWREMDLKVGLGTDNVNHTMWETMRTTIYGARIREKMGEPSSPSYYDVLEMAPIKGAGVMGFEDSVGSLEIGKKADLQLIDLKCPHIYPTADVTSSLVLYGATVNVDTVIVDGRVVKRDGKLVGLDVGKILDDAQAVTLEIWDGLYKDRPELRNLA